MWHLFHQKWFLTRRNAEMLRLMIFFCCLVGCLHDLWWICHCVNNLNIAFKLHSLRFLVYRILVESSLEVIITSKQTKITSYLFFAILLSSTKCTLFLSLGIGLILVVISTYIQHYISIFSLNAERFGY